jgi:hypothetical protein
MLQGVKKEKKKKVVPWYSGRIRTPPAPQIPKSKDALV